MRSALLVTLAIVVACRDQAAPATAVDVAGVRSEPPPAPVTAASLDSAPPAVRARCTTTIGATVTEENHTHVRGDVCAAFSRVAARVPIGIGMPPNVELHVSLAELEGRRPIHCEVAIAVVVGPRDLGAARAGAKVTVQPGLERVGARECVEAVIEALLQRQIWPMVRQHAQTATSAQPTTGSSGIPVP